MTDLLRMSDTQQIAAVAGCIVFIVGATLANVLARREANHTRPERD